MWTSVDQIRKKSELLVGAFLAEGLRIRPLETRVHLQEDSPSRGDLTDGMEEIRRDGHQHVFPSVSLFTETGIRGHQQT